MHTVLLLQQPGIQYRVRLITEIFKIIEYTIIFKQVSLYAIAQLIV